MTDREPPRFVPAYTLLIFTVAGLALTMVASHQMFATLMTERDNPAGVAVMRFLQSIEVIYSVFGIVVGVLRVRRSRLAPATTAALSIMLIMWPPFGTATFCYWLFSVRRRERCEATVRSDGL